MRFLYYCVPLLTLLSHAGVSLSAQEQVQLSGFVYESETREPLIGASVALIGTNSGTTTNNYGHYALSIPDGEEVRVRFSYVGYHPLDTLIRTQREDLLLDISLEPLTDELSEVTVLGSHTTEVGSLETGRIRLTGDDISSVPSFLGEQDLIKYVQLLPGVAKGQEGFSGPIVRGGNVDENLYLLDGNVLYNVSHLGGLFSTFNHDAIKGVNFYKGSFPARYGGRLSSVMDIRTKEGDLRNYHGKFSIGLISSKFFLEGPIWKEHTSFSIAARRSYIDLIAIPLQKYANRKRRRESEQSGIVSGSNDQLYSYNLYDINARITHKVNERHKLFLSFYTGRDNLDFKMEDESRNEVQNSSPISAATEGLFGSILEKYNVDPLNDTGDVSLRQISRQDITDLGIHWGNTVGSLGWNSVIGSNLFANTTVSYGKFLFDIGLDQDSKATPLVQLEVVRNGGNPERPEVYHEMLEEVRNSVSFSLKSSIEDFIFRTDWEYRPNNDHYIRFGLDGISHKFTPSIRSINSNNQEVNEFIEDINEILPEDADIRHSVDVALYAEDEYKLNETVSANLGFRSSMLSTEGKSYFSFEPRISLNYRPIKHFSIKASYAEMSQYLHLLQATSISLPTDLWVPVTSKIKPMRSRQGVLGFYFEPKGFEFAIEGYYKQLQNILAYKDGVQIMLMGKDWENSVTSGEGRSYGAEFLVRRTLGQLSGWLSYTLSWSDRIFPNGLVNNGLRFPDKYDNRHKLNLALIYKPNKRFDCSAVWVFSSGNRQTIGGYKYLNAQGSEQEYIPQRNNYTLPNYHRLDLSLNFHDYGKVHKTLKHTWNISVYNAYVHNNAFILVDDTDYEDQNRRKLYSLSPFIIIPTISYIFEF